MTTLVQEKVQQAVQILRELGIDTWLTFVRETSAGGDPVLPLIYGQDLTWNSALIIHASGETVAIVGRYEAEAAHRTGAYSRVIPYDQSIRPELIEVLTQLDPKQIAINYSVNDVHADGLTYGMYQLLIKYLAGTYLQDRLVSAEGLIAKVRGRKTPNEVQLIRDAVETTRMIYENTFAFMQIGMTEKQVAEFMHSQLQVYGVDAAWEYDHCPAVNTGPESNVGHAGPTAGGHVVRQNGVTPLMIGIALVAIGSTTLYLFPAADVWLLKDGDVIEFAEPGSKSTPPKVKVRIPKGSVVMYPSAHAEGKLMFPQSKQSKMLDKLLDNDQVMFRYVDPEGEYAGYPWCPNGSLYNIAGICNPAGNVLGSAPSSCR